MQDGDSNPVWDSAASAQARSDAVSSALEGVFDAPQEQSSDEGNQITGNGQDAAETPSQSVPSKANDGDSQEQTDEAPSADGQLSAPKNWSKERREAFEKLDPAAKQILLDRNREFDEGIRKNAETNADHRKRSEAIGEILKPFEADLQNSGLDHVSAIKFMVDERAAFNRDPAAFVLGYAQKSQAGVAPFVQHLVQLSGLTQDQLFSGQHQAPQNGQPQNEQDQWVDPLETKLESYSKALEAQVHELKSQLSQFTNSYQERENLTIHEEIRNFQSASDEGGTPLRPHYEAVKEDMRRLIETDPQVSAIPDWKVQEKLQAAYDKAVWLNADVRQSLLDERVNQGVTQQIGQQRVTQAKAAATKKGSPGASGDAVPGSMNIRDAVANAMRESGLG